MSAGKMGINEPEFRLLSRDNDLSSRVYPHSRPCQQKVLIAMAESCFLFSALPDRLSPLLHSWNKSDTKNLTLIGIYCRVILHTTLLE